MPSDELPLEHQILTDRNIALKLVGVGGAGSNAIDRLKMDNLDRVQLAVVNTDFQALSTSPVQEKVLIGSGVTRGLGAGGDPELGREAAETDREKIAAIVKDHDLVFLVAGMGGGTGSGAAPVVAEIAAEQGALVIAFVTMPFSFEGGRRLKQAEDGLQAMRRVCDAVIPLPNDALMQEGADNETVLDSFGRADEWIGRGVKSIWAMLFRTGLINLDFATLRQAFQARGGKTLFGLGSGAGEDAVAQAIASLKLCPLLTMPEYARRADRLLVNITGGTDLTLPKVNELMSAVTEQFGKDSHVIMGAVIDEAMQGRVEVCVLGTTDLGGRGMAARRPSSAHRAGRSGFPWTAPVSTPAAAQPASPVAKTDAIAIAEIVPLAEAAAARAKIDQEEFTFGELESRGHFENTDRNLFEGQDLDVPTYLRRGIKIVL
jgi:cell division protein FtsZ